MSMPVPDGIAAVMPTTLSSFPASLSEALTEHVLIGRRIRLGLGLGAGGVVSLTTA